MDKNIPKIAVVGKPNAGKSTLINRICQTRDAIISHQPMITRDRKYYSTDWNGVSFYIMDTGGIDPGSKQKLALQIYVQTKQAIDEANIIMFVVDITQPVSALDQEIAQILRKSGKTIIMVASKWDNPQGSYFTEDYLKFGFGYPFKVSAIQGIGIGDLLDEAVEAILKFYPDRQEVICEDNIPRISILGKPNVGKSTLFNSIIGQERAIVDQVEGTTRDSIDSIIAIGDSQYKFIDTAGIKKSKLNQEDLEYYSKLRSIRAIENSDISLVLIDAENGASKQDIKIVNSCIEKGVSICIVINKIDIIDDQQLKKLITDLDKKLDFASYIPFLKVSALNKKGMKDIIDTIDLLMEERQRRIAENKLMKLFKGLDPESTIYSKGKKFKIKFIRQVREAPPVFFVFSNININKKTNIKRYIENHIREIFGFIGTPIIIRSKH
ncbi:MAG: ribosome biogenesis GTPase Der [Actinomycetia bacterium]|nr:ribosome biogenesis GTPase Der [Actinomycetes bacterium]